MCVRVRARVRVNANGRARVCYSVRHTFVRCAVKLRQSSPLLLPPLFPNHATIFHEIHAINGHTKILLCLGRSGRGG